MRASNTQSRRMALPGLLVLASIPLLPFQSVAAPIASASTFVSVPPISQGNNGGTSGGILSSITALDSVEFAEARIDLAAGAAGVAVGNDRGSSRADASHFDTWFCPDPIACAALATPGSFVPVTINLHVSGSASLTPSGGFMSLSYDYDTSSLVGSSALGHFQFSFFEDPGSGPKAHVEGHATFFDYHTGVLDQLSVNIVPQGLGQVAFGIDVSVPSFIGGCAQIGCDLSQGIFTDNQSLNALIDAASDGSAQSLSSLNTFRAGFTSDLPFVSADGRTPDAAASVPEPGSLGLVLAAAIAALKPRQKRCPVNLSTEVKHE